MANVNKDFWGECLCISFILCLAIAKQLTCMFDKRENCEKAPCFDAVQAKRATTNGTHCECAKPYFTGDVNTCDECALRYNNEAAYYSASCRMRCPVAFGKVCAGHGSCSTGPSGTGAILCYVMQ